MGKISNFIAALKKNSDGRYCYVDEYNGIQVGCSDFTRLNLYEGGIISYAERNDSNGLWAIKNYKKILEDKSRFECLPPTAEKQDGDILFYAYHHVAVYYNGGIFEAAPRENHYLSQNGKTAVGYFPNFHNCSGGSLTNIYRIIEDEPVEEKPVIKIIKKEEPVKINMIQLKKGSRNTFVSILQLFLSKAGFGVHADGAFGNLTDSAVRRYQAANGLEPDGIVGPKTWASFLKNLPVVQRNNSGLYVSALQLFLNARTGSRLTVDGIFGPATQMAVKSFQKSKGLGQDGICGPKTWGALFA